MHNTEVKLKANKEGRRDSELRLLRLADKDLAALLAFRDILDEIGMLVTRHNGLIAENGKLKPGRGSSKRNEIINTAKALKSKLDVAAAGHTLVRLQDETDSSFLKQELNRLLHIASALQSEYREILHAVIRNSRTRLTISSSELDYFADGIIKAQQLIHNRRLAISAR